ncbi:MAG: hypothetical protein GC172_05160 [Phycisphaera sp.]|nr:hypothetical protein [Phycisphaera sp.]
MSDPGLEGLGAFTGSMEWTYLGGNAGSLTVTLMNTSPVANGGYLTGFVFNVAPDVKVEYDGAQAGWSAIFSASAAPFGVFDYGAALGGDWLGGGSPLVGLAVGSTWSFGFSVGGDAEILAGLGAHDFFDESTGVGFVARFRGFEDGGSDKVTSTLPGPATLAAPLFAAVLGRSRRRR